MAEIQYEISPSTRTSDFTVKMWESQSDGAGAEVFTETVPAPHSAPFSVIATGLDKVPHIIRLYDASTNELLHYYEMQPQSNAVFSPIRFKIGDGLTGTPAADTATYTNSLLIGLGDDDYLVLRNNVGFLHPGTHYDNDPVTGGFALISPDTFNDKEEFTILRQPQLTALGNDSVVGKWFKGFVDVSADKDYDNTDLRKLIRFSGTCAYSFPVGVAVPIGYGFLFQHYGATGTGTIKFLNAPLKWGTTTKTELTIEQFQEAAFSFDGTNWNVIYRTPVTPTATPTTKPGDILGCGNFSIGDIPAGDPEYIVTHNLNIVGDYNVYFSIKSNTNWAANNKLPTPDWWHDEFEKANKFHFSIQEISGETQDVSISWLIIQL